MRSKRKRFGPRREFTTCRKGACAIKTKTVANRQPRLISTDTLHISHQVVSAKKSPLVGRLLEKKLVMAIRRATSASPDDRECRRKPPEQAASAASSKCEFSNIAHGNYGAGLISSGQFSNSSSSYQTSSSKRRARHLDRGERELLNLLLPEDGQSSSYGAGA